MSNTDDGTHALSASRRNVVRGAAWSVPVVAVATTAPAFAASPVPCPVVPGSAQWTATTGTGSLSSKNDTYSWDTSQDKWIVFKDASTAGSATFQTRSPAIAVTAGSTITGTFQLWWGYGNNNANTSNPSTFDILVNNTVVKSIATRTPGAGTVGSYNSQSFTYTVPAGTTSAVITYRFVVPATTQSRNADDDIVATRLSFGNCVR